MAIFFVEFFGWASNTMIKLAMQWLQIDAKLQWYILSVVGYVTQITLSLNAPILCLLRSISNHLKGILEGFKLSCCFSPEYKRAFINLLDNLPTNASSEQTRSRAPNPNFVRSLPLSAVGAVKQKKAEHDVIVAWGSD